MLRSHTLNLRGPGGSPVTPPANYGSLRRAINRSYVDDRAGDFEDRRMSEEAMTGLPKAVKAFYEAQNELLDFYREVDSILDNTIVSSPLNPAPHSLESAPLLPKGWEQPENPAAASAFDFVLNVNLAISEMLHFLLRKSLSSFYQDLLSTLIIFMASLWIRHRGKDTEYEYPTGKRRLEPISIVIFSVFMQASFIQVGIESTQRLFDRQLESMSIPRIGLIVSIATIGIKLVVWVWCRTYKNSSIRALAKDAENDVVFNAFSLLFPWLGGALRWPHLDPAGGLLLSCYIIYDWGQTLYEQVTSLAGQRASPAQHSRVVYLVTRFSPLVKSLQHVSVFHLSPEHYIVEVDVIVDPSTPLPLAHNLGESIQMALESLDGIERAYVHLDFQANPATGHKNRIVSLSSSTTN